MTVSARRVAPKDAGLLFEWVNSKDSLENKRLTSGPVKWEDHQQWFSRRLGTEGVHMFMLIADDTPVGQIRFEQDDSAYLVDIFLAPEARNRGLAGDGLELCILQLRETLQTPVLLRAEVKINNLPSQRLFERKGFEKRDSGDGFITYVLSVAPDDRRFG